MDLTQLEAQIHQAIDTGGKSAIGTNLGDLKGLRPDEVEGIMKSPCAALKWLEDNTPYSYQTFVELTFEDGRQGIRAFNAQGKQVGEIAIPIYSGEDSDPMKIIYKNNRAIIRETVKYVVSLQS